MNSSILIIDDETWGVKSLAECIELSTDNVIHVDIAQTIEQAINLIEINKYSAILCDLMMPPEIFSFNGEILIFHEPNSLNGRKIIEYCINNGISKKTKIIVTSIAFQASLELIEEYKGEIDILRKPFLVEDLLNKINNAH